MKSVSIPKAAAEMDVSETWVRRALSRGDLRGHRVGRSIRVYAESIEDYQRRNEIRPDQSDEAAPTARKPRKTGPRREAYQKATSTLQGLIYT